MTTVTADVTLATGRAGREPRALSLSMAALRAARLGEGEGEFAALAEMRPRELRDALPTDREKLAFWINVYNAAIQRELRREPGLYRHRLEFFARRGIEVAGRQLSFNAIEHGILRRSMFAYSLGYISNPLPRGFERQFRLGRRDPRVHFALNCGAASCPPIAAYDADSIDAQLDLATRSYLEHGTTYDQAEDVVTVPRLFLWFRGDFGGPAGTKELLRRFGIIPVAAYPRLRYGGFDWSLTLGEPGKPNRDPARTQ